MFRKLIVALAVIAWTVPLVAGEKSRQQLISELDALIDRADEMVVYGEGFKREFVIYRSSKRKDFEELKSAITLKSEGGPFLCACVDGPEITLLKNKKEIATVWNHEGTAIGSSVWDGDWENSDPERWLRWFDAREMKNARAFYEDLSQERLKREDDERRWMKAMPSSIRPLWDAALKQYVPDRQEYPDLKQLNAALAEQYPEMLERIRALMAWYGSGAESWSGSPAYEGIARRLLDQYPAPVLIKAAEGRQLTKQELEGTAKLLADTHTPIPAELRRMLLEHCMKNSNKDQVEFAKKVFAADE